MSGATSSFTPLGAPVNISASGTHAEGTIVIPTDSPKGGVLLITNPGSTVGYIRWGAAGQVAVTTDQMILGPSAQTFGCDVFPAQVSVILASGTATIQVTPGIGL